MKRHPIKNFHRKKSREFYQKMDRLRKNKVVIEYVNKPKNEEVKNGKRES